MKKKVFAICGSIREKSSNRGILLALQDIFGEELDFEVYKDISKFPHFSPDIAMPAVLVEFKKRLETADLFLISTPEYAHGIPGVLKNALDWLVSDENFPGKNVGVIFASTGDGEHIKRSLVEVLKTMSADINENKTLNIQGVRSKIDKDGYILHHESREKLKSFVNKLLDK